MNFLHCLYMPPLIYVDLYWPVKYKITNSEQNKTKRRKNDIILNCRDTNLQNKLSRRRYLSSKFWIKPTRLYSVIQNWIVCSNRCNLQCPGLYFCVVTNLMKNAFGSTCSGNVVIIYTSLFTIEMVAQFI